MSEKTIAGGSRALILSVSAFSALVLVAIGGTACLTRMPGHNPRFALAPLTLRERTLRASLAADVRALSVEIGERNVGHPRAYASAADWTASQLRQAGLQVHEESYAAGQTEARNLVGEIAGAVAKDQIVIVGAHYDSVKGTPGADDNASGIAALLALARHFARSQPQRTLRFVAFANEEPPFFQTEQMGSLVYARRCTARHENVVAMLSLQTRHRLVGPLVVLAHRGACGNGHRHGSFPLRALPRGDGHAGEVGLRPFRTRGCGAR
jgi:hypothetical protein